MSGAPIYYIVMERHAYTMRDFCRLVDHPLARDIQVIPYERFLKQPPHAAPDGIYIFSDIERLTYPQALEANERWAGLAARGKRCKLLNHPLQSVRRQQFLETLYQRGINTFQVYPLEKFQQPQRWPVFLREKHEHKSYDAIGLIHSAAELAVALQKLSKQRKTLDNLLVVEFCDTSDVNGVFCKYGAACVDGVVVPRCLFFNKHWMVQRVGKKRTTATTEEEFRYVTTNPHAAQIRQLFQLAQIDFGRIDYAMLGDRLQVWEINTNPNLLDSLDLQEVDRLRLHRKFLENFLGALTLLQNSLSEPKEAQA